ncbi:hypothetical protein AGMMS50212_16670 [Spirochaetia bacterium]|nr:hypothetical protein AGMMS50212_16670 [Spirochaetia bacterium]
MIEKDELDYKISCERVGAKKKRKYDAAKTPLQRLFECSFDEKLEGIRIKQDALRFKEAIPLVAQKCLMDKAVEHLLSTVHDVPVTLPRRGRNRHG